MDEHTYEPVTRRRVLGGAAGLLAGLAGCSSSTSTTVDVGDPQATEHVERDPETVALRNPIEELPVWLDSTETEDDPGRADLPREGLVADTGTASRLTYADVAGVSEARSFVSETDFESETLLLEPYRIGECYEQRLCAVGWSETEYHTWYARTYRPPDYECRTDDDDTVVRFIRIPDVLDPEKIRSTGSGVNTTGCWRPRQMGIEATESESPGSATAEGTSGTAGGSE